MAGLSEAEKMESEIDRLIIDLSIVLNENINLRSALETISNFNTELASRHVAQQALASVEIRAALNQKD